MIMLSYGERMKGLTISTKPPTPNC